MHLPCQKAGFSCECQATFLKLSSHSSNSQSSSHYCSNDQVIKNKRPSRCAGAPPKNTRPLHGPLRGVWFPTKFPDSGLISVDRSNKGYSTTYNTRSHSSRLQVIFREDYLNVRTRVPVLLLGLRRILTYLPPPVPASSSASGLEAFSH